MKFTKIKKRKVLETWQHKNRKTGLASYIYCNPNGEYYFVVLCFLKKCGLQKCAKENCTERIYYNSLEQGILYNSFDKCRETVIKWHKENRKG